MNDSNKSSNQKQGGFWTTFPGILTGLASVITAVGGLITGLYQAGLIGGAHEKKDDLASQEGCLVFLQEGNTLNWKIKNYGELGNVGTLEIESVDSEMGEWRGEQITETKGNSRSVVEGTFEESEMSFDVLDEPENWVGRCESGRIAGKIVTSYGSDLTFEMQLKSKAQ